MTFGEGEGGSCKWWRRHELLAALGGEAHGDAPSGVAVRRVAPIERSAPDAISFVTGPKYLAALANTQAGMVVVPPSLRDAPTRAVRILHANPYAYYARLVGLIHAEPARPAGVHPSAVVDSPVPDSVTVGANAVIGQGVVFGERVAIGAGCVVGDGVHLGEETRLHANVTVYSGCSFGKRCIVHGGAVIGADGFGFAPENGAWVKIPQIGAVRIGDDVEIGANTTIDRGALEDTVIGNGVKLDNQIQIAHNVAIGDHSAMAGCVGVAGSTSIGQHCTIGGAAMIIGHLNIGDNVHVSAGTLIGKSLPNAGHYTGSFPMDRHEAWLKNAAQIRHLDALLKRVRTLEKKLANLTPSAAESSKPS